MHRLFFEPTWEKNVSYEIRKKIEKRFSDRNTSTHMFDILWTTRNHRGHLLVITLIHNELEENLSLIHEQIGLYKNNQLIAETHVTEEKCFIPKYTSMPWTFIFRDHTQLDLHGEETDKLELRKI
ncbi:SLAP domain-containing protein [Saliterribacillus persicus]|uniref:SLAP domain-containing protein n=1 Tax=Saliterribacillus persicus TaxID=930114 RepID=A0A368X479_9BACI|nr:SLAP domain-containing protein [Saliterribacillus persicus]RCW62733.1 SLAP domain-containing protein [Saliterribacillus persicus]